MYAHRRVAILKAGRFVAALDAERNVGQADAGRPFFGEMALLDGLPRMAAVHVRSPCTLLVLRRQRFATFARMLPDFKARLRFYKDLRMRETSLLVPAIRPASPQPGPPEEDGEPPS